MDDYRTFIDNIVAKRFDPDNIPFTYHADEENIHMTVTSNIRGIISLHATEECVKKLMLKLKEEYLKL